MKKKLSINILVLLMLPMFALAASENAQGNTTQTQTSTATQTQNAGEDNQIQTRTEAEIETQTQQDIESSKQLYQTKNQTGESRSSEVAKAVQAMLEVANRTNNPSVGEQIRVIAREQNQAEDSANKIMDKIQERSGLAKLFIGANYGQMKEIKKIMDQNQERIRELQQIMLKLDNEADKTAIQSQINILELQNLNLANQLTNEGRGFTFLGWLIRWFYGV